MGVALILGLIGLAAANVWRYDHPRNTPTQTADRILPDAGGLAGIAGLPASTESLMGSPVHPISLIVLARDEAALSEAMRAAGWDASRLPSAGLVFDALYAALAGALGSAVTAGLSRCAPAAHARDARHAADARIGVGAPRALRPAA